MSIYDGGGWGNLSTERPGSLVDSGRTRRLPAFHSQQHWMERAHCRRQHLKNQEIGFFGVFDRESISHGPTSLKIVVVVVVVGDLKTLLKVTFNVTVKSNVTVTFNVTVLMLKSPQKTSKSQKVIKVSKSPKKS